MKYFNTLLFSLLALTLSTQITTGSITYSMEMEGGEGQMAQALDMLKDMNMVVSFNPDMTVTEVDMMGMIQMKTITEGTTSTQYMDMMGQKIKMVHSQEELKEMLGVEEGEELMDKMDELYKFHPVTGDTKELLGYTCKRTDITMDLEAMVPEGKSSPEITDVMKEMTITAYLTEEIQVSNFDFMMAKNLQFKGAPLLMTIDMGVMKMTMRAIDFNKEVAPSVFQAPEGEYTEMDPSTMPGMGLDGFGF